MKDAFGVEKSFSTAVEGGFKSLALMTKAEREGIKGYHQAAHGVTPEDAAIARRLSGAHRPAGTPERTVNRKGRPVDVHELDINGRFGQSHPVFPKPGQSQRQTPGRVILPKKANPWYKDSRAHEIEHTVSSKPSSQAVRFAKHPEKLWGNERMANQPMSLSARLTSDYDVSAKSGTLLPKFKETGLGANDSYARGWKQGRKTYLKVDERLNAIGKRAGAGKVVTLALRPKTALGIPITDPAMVLATPKSVWAKGGLKVRQAPQLRFPIAKNVPVFMRDIQYPVSRVVKDPQAAKYIRLRLNAHRSGRGYPRYKDATTPSAFTNGQIIGHGKASRTRSRTQLKAMENA